MRAAILSIGTELTRGEINNTNSTWLATQLSDRGAQVTAIETIPDDRAVIGESLTRLAKGNAMIVSTGGLGPTTDDLTSESVAQALQLPLQRDDAAAAYITQRLEARGRSVSESNLRQADFPEGSQILANPWGTAPGFSVAFGQCRAYFLPGVPREMRPMFERYVAPAASPEQTFTFQAHIKTFGAPESAVNDTLEGVAAQHDVEIGYRAHFPEIEVKALARASSHEAAKSKATAAALEIRKRLGQLVYGEGSITLPQAVGELLRAGNYKLGLAESCTGGLVAELFTANSCSDYFVGGAVTYCNSLKQRLLGVKAATLEQHGAVSENVAREMAEGARQALGCDVALALTGIAGPDGGTETKPVGLVHYVVATPDETCAEHRVFSGDRNQVQRHAGFAGIDLIRRALQSK